MASDTAVAAEPGTNMIASFARTQLMGVKQYRILESSFLELATSAFLCGAENQFLKQSQIDDRVSHANLVDTICEICRVSEHTAIGLIDVSGRLAKKYYLIENIMQQGETAADNWLSCESDDGSALKNLVEKYENLSMFDLGIEGVNEAQEESQKQFYTAVDEDVGKLRRRALVVGVLIVLVVSAATAYWLAYGEII